MVVVKFLSVTVFVASLTFALNVFAFDESTIMIAYNFKQGGAEWRVVTTKLGLYVKISIWPMTEAVEDFLKTLPILEHPQNTAYECKAKVVVVNSDHFADLIDQYKYNYKHISPLKKIAKVYSVSKNCSVIALPEKLRD